MPVLLLWLLTLSLPLFASDGEAFTRDLVAREVTGNPELYSRAPKNHNGPALHAKDFGFSVNASALENALALGRLSQALREKKASSVAFEAGAYFVQLGGNLPGLLLSELKDFTLQGNGARLYFRDSLKPGSANALLTISNCESVLVKDFTIGWDTEYQGLAYVAKVSKLTSSSVEFEIVSGGKLHTNLTIRGGREWDLKIGNRSPKGFAPGFTKPARIISETQLIFEELPKTKIELGMASLLKVAHHASVWGVALLGKNDHLTFERFSILGVPNTAMNGYSKHLWIKDCVLAPAKDTESLASEDGFMTTADYFVFERNRVSYTADDVMNFTGGQLGTFLGGGVLPDGENSMIADKLQHYASKDAIFVGAEFFLADESYEPSAWRSRIKSFEWQLGYYPETSKARNRCKLVFEDPVPDLSKTSNQFFFLMQDSKNKGGYLIRDNVISNTLCHGIWAGNGPGLIENNSFYQTAYPAIGLMMLTRWKRWFKGFYPEGVIIRGNTLEHCNTALRKPADLYVMTGWDDSEFKSSPYPAVRHVIIESNVIRNSSQSALAVMGVSNVSILNNRILNPGRDKDATTNGVTQAALFLTNVHQARLSGNVLEESSEANVKGIKILSSVNVTE